MTLDELQKQAYEVAVAPRGNWRRVREERERV